MDCTIEGRTLAKAARAVKSIAGSSYIPALNHARIDGSYNGLEMKATDLESWIEYRIDAPAGAYDGAHAFIDTDRMLGAVKSLKGSQAVRLAEGVLQIGGAVITGADDIEADYPIIPALNPCHAVMSWSGAEFKSIAKRWKATAKKSGQTTRLTLCAVNVEYDIAGNGARFTTTDGYSMDHEAYGAALGPDALAVMIPLDALMKAAAAAGAKDTVQLGFMTSPADRFNQHAAPYARIRIASSAGSILYFIKTTDGEFPDYRRVIPKASSAKASIDIAPADLERIASAAREFAPSDSRAITLTIESGGFGSAPHRSLRITAESIAGAYSEVIDIIGRNQYGADDIEPTSFSADYLKALAGFGSASMSLHFQGPLQALRIDYGPDQVAVLMPLNLKK